MLLPPLAIDILTNKGVVVDQCSVDDTLCLITGDRTARQHTLVTRLRDANQWLRCPCGRILHPVRGPQAFLRINDGDHRPAPGLGCALCEALPADTDDPKRGRISRSSRSRLKLILSTPTWRDGTSDGSSRHSEGGAGEQYRSQRSMLRQFLQAPGWNRLIRPLRPPELWRQLRLGLRESTTSLGGQQLRFSAITWLPDDPLTPPNVGWRIARDWCAPQLVPEMWMMAIVERDGLTVDGNELQLTWTDMAGRVGSVRLPRAQVAGTVCTPPYIAFIVGHASREPVSWTPKRIVLEGIVSADSPVPVESGEERRAVQFLQEIRCNYERVLFPGREVWPDILLHRHRVILEIQGCRRDGYSDRKRRSHRRMLDVYRGWRMVTWDVDQGETLDDLRAKLLPIVNR
jgi:hypothetical protein